MSARGDYVLSCEQMRAADREVLRRTGLPTSVLMENAGRGVAEVILRRASRRSGSPAHRAVPHGAQVRPQGSDGAALAVAVVCGSGNNGGDGFVAARHLAMAGCACRVLLTAARDRIGGDALAMLTALDYQPEVAVVDLSNQLSVERWAEALAAADVVVDAIYGTGLRADVSGIAEVAITAINSVSALRIAIDIPSGLDGDTGFSRGVAVRADVTVCIAARKIGLAIDPEAACGEVEIVGFGAPVALDEALRPFCFWTDEALVRAALPKRNAAAHKGSSGHLVVVAGARGKTGAALLTARAALRAGAGLVTVASTAGGQIALDAKVVEAMTMAYSDREEDACDDSFDRLADLCIRPNVRAIAVGPGIPTGPVMGVVVERVARELTQPVVLDADALNVLGTSAATVLAQARGPRVITPHPGEMARLVGCTTAQVQADRLGTARAFAGASGAVVVLKGARTLVVAPDGTVFVNPAVEPALATAGSGDVLTGVVGALLAQGVEPLLAARAGVFLHGRAGAHAAAIHGVPGVIAGDLPDAVAAIRSSWSSEAARAR